MLFHTFEFAAFFVLVFLTWLWIATRAPRLQIPFLILVSFIFYGAWDWRFCALLFASAAGNHYVALAVEGAREPVRRKQLLTLAIAANLGVLGLFKYFDFFLTSLNNLLFRLGFDELPYVFELVLPVGISFFTFQAISYIVDVHRGELKASKTLPETLLFISLFPQLVAGPIVRAKDMLPQIRARATALTQPQRIALGFATVMIVSGLFKKLVMANHMATGIVDEVFFDPAAYGAGDLLLAAYGYTIQIYCDFSGYSDMAIGLSALLGFVIPINFDRPFRAASMREFWRRWHISLSTWLRDYLYVPLGGNRGRPWRTRRNLMLTMVLGGLWHGAAWTFILWGALHGTFLVVETLFRAAGRVQLPRALKIFIVFHLVVLTFVIFRIESLPQLWDFLAGLTRIGMETELATPFLIGLVAFGIATHFLPPVAPRAARAIDHLPWPLTALLGAAAITFIAGVAPPGITPFIYFQF
ncbi:MAG: MBOAT family protein [Silicimonas sp.]|nr:MBOAT family protein [Silicimonas sp.]